MYRCSVCTAVQPQENIRLRWGDKTATVILFSCLVEHGLLELDKAKRIYDDVHLGIKYICNEHYVNAISFLAVKIEEVLGSFPPDVIDHFPVDLIEDIVMHLHTTAGFLDVSWHFS
ncbi:hypothetical protein GCK32_021374 [Trichostrongylus colubriformis]|uniref:Lin-15A/B-like domain-containing protein n=1 Tax=Trichostrongylus colubriformis TaxID=6319 RepID=A0AAN8J391_TRICO